MKDRALIIAMTLIIAGAALLVLGVYDLFGRGWAAIAAAVECFVVYAAIARGMEE